MKRVPFFAFFFFLLIAQTTFAMTSTHYQIYWDSMNIGGDEQATSTHYRLQDTVGGLATGFSTSSRYLLSSGYRIDDLSDGIRFDVKASNADQRVVYSAFSTSTKIVTVSDTSAFSQGDYAAIVEFVGLSQKSAVGKIIDVTPTTIEFDDLIGDVASMSVTPPDGSYVYLLNTDSLVFGTMTVDHAQTAMVVTSVSSTVAHGYEVALQASRLLQSGSHTISSVQDGAVSLGSEEYGVFVTGTRALVGSQDLPVTTTRFLIQANSAPTSGVPERTLSTYKLSIDSNTPSGSYSQEIYYTVTPLF